MLRLYEALPKHEHWSDAPGGRRHADIRSEWIAAIIEDPYEVIPEFQDGQPTTVYAGRVPEFGQWIKVVLIGEGAAQSLLTAYADRRLEQRYGGRPWQTRM